MNVVEILAAIVIVLFLVTQVVIPPWIGKPLFWLFRSGRSQKEKLIEMVDQVEVAKEVIDMSKKVRHLVDEANESMIPELKGKAKKATKTKTYSRHDE